MDRDAEHTTQTASPRADTVVLKKYGNRRLYDTTASRYVTLVEVEAMVQRGVDIQVVDAKSGDDITKEVLVQLLLERDGARASLPTALLKQAVRLANSPLKDGLVKAMQEGLDTFMTSQRAVVDAQRALTQHLQPWMPAPTPALWNPFPPPPPPGSSSPSPSPLPSSSPSSSPAAAPPAAAPAASSPDVEALRAELGQTQALVRQLLERELARGAAEAAASAEPVGPRRAARKKPTPHRA
jgi:polyhydroxyalkanoate synthesis repressor PhaR